MLINWGERLTVSCRVAARTSKHLTVERHCYSNGPSSYFQDGLIEFAGTLPAAIGKSYAQSCRRSQNCKIVSLTATAEARLLYEYRFFEFRLHCYSIKFRIRIRSITVIPFCVCILDKIKRIRVNGPQINLPSCNTSAS